MPHKRQPSKRPSSDKSGPSSKRTKCSGVEKDAKSVDKEGDGATSSRIRKASKKHLPPNQTVKLSFNGATKMLHGHNDWARKIISLFFASCFLQETFNFMVIRNLGTNLANYVLFKSVIEQIHAQLGAVTPSERKLWKIPVKEIITQDQLKSCPAMDQDFYTPCLASFNDGPRSKTENGINMQPKLKDFKKYVLQFATHGKPWSLKISKVFKETINIESHKLQVNAELYYQRNTRSLVKKCVKVFNPKVSSKNCKYVADIVMKEVFVIKEKECQSIQLKQWKQQKPPHTFKNPKLAEAFEITKRSISYSAKETELHRWLFFHQMVMQLDDKYYENSLKRFKWSPISRPSKRPHIDLNQTQFKEEFRVKVSTILKFIDEKEDPFIIFNYPGFVSPLKRYFAPKTARKLEIENISHKTLGTLPKYKNQLTKKQITIWFKIKEVLDKFYKEEPCHAEQFNNAKHSKPTEPPKLTKKEVKQLTEEEKQEQSWLYLFPSLKKCLKRNAYTLFQYFPHISTNGVDISVYLHNPTKVKQENRSALQIKHTDIVGHRIIGVDPGVNSLATASYSHFLTPTPAFNLRKRLWYEKYKRLDKETVTTRATSKEMFHKTYIDCGPLSTYHRKFNDNIKKSLITMQASSTSQENSSPAAFFSNYPNHKKEPQSMLEYLQLNKEFYVEAANIYFLKTSARWYWTSFRFHQMKYAALAKRVVTPSMSSEAANLINLREGFRSRRRGNNSNKYFGNKGGDADRMAEEEQKQSGSQQESTAVSAQNATRSPLHACHSPDIITLSPPTSNDNSIEPEIVIISPPPMIKQEPPVPLDPPKVLLAQRIRARKRPAPEAKKRSKQKPIPLLKGQTKITSFFSKKQKTEQQESVQPQLPKPKSQMKITNFLVKKSPPSETPPRPPPTPPPLNEPTLAIMKESASDKNQEAVKEIENLCLVLQSPTAEVESSVTKAKRPKKPNAFNLRKSLRKTWLLDKFLFRRIKRKAKVKVKEATIVVAFGNQSRNNTFIRGLYKSSAERLYSSLVQLVGREKVFDANEFRTSQECHICKQQVNKTDFINRQIQTEARVSVSGRRLLRRVEDMKKQRALKEVKELNEAQLSVEELERLFLGRKRSNFEIRNCDNCKRFFNRDVNASINIMNLFIQEVHKQ